MKSNELGMASVEANPGDRKSIIRRLYRQHWQELCHYVRGRFGAGPPDPQDIAQHAFTQLTALEQPQNLRNPRAFLYRVATNAAIDHVRANARQSRVLELIHSDPDEDALSNPTPERILLGREDLKVLEDTIMGLAERDRTFFLLNRMEGASFAEIARRTGMSPSGVRLIVEHVLECCQSALNQAENARPTQARTAGI
jgi:RNA polymerase sigma-70 factor (ECF subfamily)